jgi:hypothetical protein
MRWAETFCLIKYLARFYINSVFEDGCVSIFSYLIRLYIDRKTKQRPLHDTSVSVEA